MKRRSSGVQQAKSSKIQWTQGLDDLANVFCEEMLGSRLFYHQQLGIIQRLGTELWVSNYAIYLTERRLP